MNFEPNDHENSLRYQTSAATTVLTRSAACAAFAIGSMLIGCTAEHSRWIPPERECPGALKPVWVADSSLTICVVTSFRTHDLLTWTRSGENGEVDVLEIRTDVSATEASLTGGWPPTLRATEQDAENVTVHIDTIAGAAARTEIGSVARTLGEPRVNAFISGWGLNDARRAIARGRSVSRPTLDTLLLMLRSAKPWPGQSK